MNSAKIFNPLPNLWYGGTKDVEDIWVVGTDTTGTYFLGYVFMPPENWSPAEVSGLLTDFKQRPMPKVGESNKMGPEAEAVVLSVWDLFLQLPQFFENRADLMSTIDNVLELVNSGNHQQAWTALNEFQIAKQLPIIARNAQGVFSTCESLEARAVTIAEDQFRTACACHYNSKAIKGSPDSTANNSICSSASSTTSPLKYVKPWPELVCTEINSATKRLQNGQWQFCFSLRSATGLIAGQVFRDLMPHDDISSLKAMFHHVILKEPIFLTVTIVEPKSTGVTPIAVGVVNMSPVIDSVSLTTDMMMYKVADNDVKGWGRIIDTMISGGASLGYANQIHSLRVTIRTSPSMLPGNDEPFSAQSFIMDSFNPQDRIIVTSGNFILTSEDQRGPYWVEIVPSEGVKSIPAVSRSFPVKNGQALGQTVQICGNIINGTLHFKVYNKTSLLFTGTSAIKSLQDGNNTVALTCRGMFAGYIKLSVRTLISNISYQPTVDKLLNGGVGVAAIPLLSQSTLTQFYRPLLSRVLQSFEDPAQTKDAMASLAAMCEVSDRVGYLMKLFFVMEQTTRPDLLDSILNTYTEMLDKCPKTIHKNMPALLQWLVPQSEPLACTINLLEEKAVAFATEGPKDLVLAFLKTFVPLLTSLQPITPISQLGAFFDSIVASIRAREDGLLSDQLYSLLAEISFTKILFVGNLWVRVLGYTKPAWISDDLPTLLRLATLLKNIAQFQDPQFDHSSYLVPLVLSLMSRLIEKPAVCVGGGALFTTEIDPTRCDADLRGLLVCELTLVLGLLLERGEAVNMNEHYEVRQKCLDALRVVTHLVEAPVFPKRWISLYALQIRIAGLCLVYAQHLLPILPTTPTEAELTDTDIYATFLMICARLCSLRITTPDLLYPAEETAVRGILGHTFGDCLNSFCEVWDRLGTYDTSECANGYQVVMINSSRSIIQHLAQCLLLYSDRDSREKIGSVLHSIIIPGYAFTDEATGHRFLSLLLSSLDNVLSSLAKSELPSPETVLNFMDALNLPDAALVTRIEVFLNLSIGYYLYENLFTAGSVLRFCGDLKLMSLFELYCTRIISIFRNNFRVHGILYLELAKLYGWHDFNVVSAMDTPCLPQQRAAGRKRKLILMAIDCFAKAKEYALAISSSKLLFPPSEELGDYRMLSDLSKKLSTLYSKAISTPELVTHYYLVTFPKHRLPLISQKRYILDGGGLRIDEIRVALQAEYSIPCFIQDFNTGQQECILVKTVTPYFANKSMPDSVIASFYEYVPLPGTTSVTNLKVEETVYHCFQTFPSISGMCLVETVRRRVLGPIEAALKAVNDKVGQFKILLGKTVERTPGFEIQLEMALSGVITAPVNGGVSQYQQFLADAEMKAACEELGKYVKHAIEIYSSAVTEDRKPQVDLFWSEFHKVFKSEVI